MAEGGREASSETRQMEHGQISNTVEVQGFLKNTSQELLELYFENSRRSGGGDMEEVKIRDEVAYITFKDAEVAQRVVSHNRHQVEGQTLTVKLFHPLPPKPCYENRVLIQGLNNAVTEELLRNFLETVTEAEVREFLYGEEEGNVVVTLSDNIDIGQLRKTFQENSIEGAFLRVARVAISNCILLQNIQTSTSHDTVLFYFDNKRRSGGGDVERVEMKADEGYCLVYFEDHSVINRVLSQSHKVDGADLEVHLHHECLGRRSSMNKSDPYLRISNPVNKDGRIDEVENTDNQSNDEDSCSVSSDPDKESDFIEVQERQESEGGTIGIYRIVAFIYPCNKSVSLINEKVENDKTDLIVTPVLLPFSSTGPQNSPFIVTQSTRVLNMYVPLSIDGDQQAEQLLIENIVATLRYSEEKEYGTVRFKINPIGGWKIEPFVKVFLYAINHFFSKSLDTNRWKVYLCTSDLHIFAEMKAAAIDYFECFITAHNKASDAYLVTNGAAPGKAPTTAESKTDSNTPTGVQDQSSGPQSERRKLPQIPELQPTGPNTVTVSSPVIPVGNTSVSFSNLGARPKETKPLEAGKEQRGNRAMSTEELWQKIPAWNKKDVMICYGKTSCVLFPSNDVDMDESIFFQSLFLDQHSWSKCFLEYLQKKQFSITKENVRISGKSVQHIIVSSKTEHKMFDKYQLLYELVQECGIRVRLLKKKSSECEHILQESSSALVAEDSVSIYRNIQGDKLVLIGQEQDLKEIMKVYGLESIEGKGYFFGESLEVSSHDAFLFTSLNLSKFLHLDKFNVKCHVSKGINKPTLIFVGMSLKQISEASESTTRFLEKVPCDKLYLQKEKLSLIKQNETKIYVEERLKQKCANCVICVDDEAVKIFSVTENQIKNAKWEIERCIKTHILPTSIYKKLFEQNLNGGKFKIISNSEDNCFVVCTYDISKQILEIIRCSTTQFFCSSISKIEWDFICQHYDETLNRIKERYGVKITAMNNGLQVESENGINKEELEKEIRQLLPERKENIPVDPSLEDFVMSEEGRESLKQLAVDNKTIYDIHVGDDGAKDACDNLLCSWYFENVSQQILLVQGRAADLHVDCLVIPVNERMVPLTYVEHGIRESFDEEMRKEVADKSSNLGQHIDCSVWIVGEHKGTLKCNKLPVYLTVRNVNRIITREELYDKLKEIFTKAESLKLESVGLPVEYLEGVSKNKIAEMLSAAVEAAFLFFKHGKGQNLKKVYLCTMKKEDADLKINEVEKTLEETKTSTSKSKIRKGIKSLLRFPNDEIKTKVMIGNLHETKADVLVNTVTKSLDLGKGVVSKQIKVLAGQGIQDELKRNYPDGIMSLEIAVTEPYGLVGFKKVFHVAVDELEINITEKIKILKVLTFKCLEMADKLKMSSVAFPALGTGGRDYPFRDVAWAMFEAVSEFQCVGKKHLKIVKFVLFQRDDKTIQAFSSEENRRKEKRDPSRTRIEVGKVPELLKGRINSGKRPEFEIVIESKYSVPSFAVEVFIKVQKGHKEIPRCSISYADITKGNWNDWYQIETSDEIDMFKKGIETCLSQSTTDRVTHLLFHVCQESSMSAYSQVQCITDVILHGEQRYLQCVTVSVLSQSEFENIKWKIEENKKSKNLFQGFISMVGLDNPQIIWTSSYLPVMPSGMTIVLRSNTEDHLQGAKEAISAKLRMQMTIKPQKIYSKVPNQDTESTTPQKCQDESPNAWRNKVEGRSALTPEKTDVPGSCPSKTDLSVVDQEDIMKLYEERLDSKETNLSKGLSSSSLDEESYSIFDVLKNVSEVEFKALKIIENGFEKINAALSWDDGAIKLYGPSACTISVIKELSSHLRALRIKQVEISLDEEEKNVVKHIIEEMKSKDTICILDEKNSQVVVYTDKQDDILKFKHKLKLKTGRVKESGRSRKRFAENIQSLEASQGVLISSFRSAEIRQEFSCFKDSSDVAVFYTKENIKVAVYVANILNVSVDCIVNDANGNLQHGGGVAKMIADAAGPQLVQEGDTIIRKKGRIPVGVQVTTTAGRLPYRCVIHTVGPCWSDYQPHSLQKVKDCEESLYRAIYGCFCEAEKMGLSTIALPAVSSGIHAVPQDMCAVQYARAVIDYSRNSEPGKCLKEIHFIDKLSNLVTLMQDTFRIMIQNGKLPNYNTENYVISLSSCQGQILLETGRKVHRKQDFAASKSQYETTKPNELSPVYYESEEHFVFQVSVKPVVHIYQGNILNLRNMDAVVCPDNSRGTGVGMIASELSKKQRYKQHKEKRFRMMKPDLGDVVITFGEDNPFNTVVYVVIENNSPQKPGFMSTMKKSIDNILRKTNEWVNVKTIAMPLFGVKHGLLTEKSWTELFLDRFLAFCHEVKNPNLEEVHIIVDLFSRSTCSTVRKVFIDFADEVNNASLQPPAV